MVACDECGRSVNRRTAKYYLAAGTLVVRLLCQACQSRYPSNRQYSPSNGPTRSRIRSDESALADDPHEVTQP